jgi:hypothetical protein
MQQDAEHASEDIGTMYVKFCMELHNQLPYRFCMKYYLHGDTAKI